MPDEPLNDADLKAFVEAHNIPAKLVYPSAPTPTVPAAAAALGVAPEAVIKSLVFLSEGEPYLIIAGGEARVSEKRLRDTLGVSRRKLRMATPDEARELTGFTIGAMPLFGHRRVLPTLLDTLTVKEGTSLAVAG